MLRLWNKPFSLRLLLIIMSKLHKTQPDQFMAVAAEVVGYCFLTAIGYNKGNGFRILLKKFRIDAVLR